MEISKYYDPKTKIISMPDDPTKVQLNENGVGDWLFSAMNDNLNAVAQIDAETGEEQPTSVYLQKCIRAALEMRRLGISSGDIISFCTYNHLDATVPFIATQFLGAICASLDPSLSLDETINLINLVNPKIIFVSDNAEELITQARKQVGEDFKIVVFGKSEENLQFSQFVEEKNNENKFKPKKVQSLQETAVILFSSGTTGLPKGICLSQEFCMWHIQSTPLSASLVFASLYWISNTFATFLCIKNSFPKIICKYMDPEKLWGYLQKYNIDSIFLSPFDAIRAYRHIPTNYKSNLQRLFIGGSSFSNENLIKYQKALGGTDVIYAYALTELFSVLKPLEKLGSDFNKRGEEVKPIEKLGSVGIPMNNRSYKIVDPETEETLGFNERGELRIKTKWCMNGYYNQDSSSCWDKDGFFKTGDIFYYDEDFCFYMVDRIKEMFKYKSWHIVPAKLENILLQHPEIAVAAVIGIPHAEDDNHIMAVVQRTQGSKITVEEVKKFLDDKVDDRHKLRGGVKFLETIPTTPSTKIKRQVLKAMFIR